MGCMSRYGGWQDDTAPPRKQPLRLKYVVAGFMFVILLGGGLACFPLTVIFIPKPQLSEYMPSGIHCATCEEIWLHNRDLFNRDDMFCYGPPTYDRPTRKDEEVMFKRARRCWRLKAGHDIWMRPIQVTAEETKEWDGEAQRAGIRANTRP